ncbi:unnamed protein product [Ambrosiozyma monospora]|uniref:Unnamed protein product n=1 Tax=Ambrosiozyma monospora TaxID=43982 RepID=A0ACB5SUZ1_AMBMO|nr:unnamed protein product [Ambrosiozyma monospora]
MSKQVNLNSVVQLRNECDEHLSPVFTKLGYKETFTLTDLKLAVGYLSVLAAGLLFQLDKKFKNDFNNKEYVFYTTIAVAVGAGFHLAFLFVNTFVSKNIKFQGVKGKKKLNVSTVTKSKTDPSYFVTVELDGKKVDQVVPFNTVFNSNGYLEYAELETKLQSIVNKLEKEA